MRFAFPPYGSFLGDYSTNLAHLSRFSRRLRNWWAVPTLRFMVCRTHYAGLAKRNGTAGRKPGGPVIILPQKSLDLLRGNFPPALENRFPSGAVA